MIHVDKTKEELVDEILNLRRIIGELESLEDERNKAEEELKVAQKYAQDLINSSLDMIIAVDRDRIIIEFNKAAEKALGYTKEEVLGKHIDILYENAEVGLRISETIKKTGSFIGEAINKRKDGEYFPSFLSCSVLYDTAGKFIGIMGISRDITQQKIAEEELKKHRIHLEELVKERTAELTEANIELQEEISRRKQAEEALAAEKERLAVTLRSIGDGVIATDVEGKVALINKVAEELTGWTEEIAIGMPLFKVFHIINEKTRQPCENPVEKVLKTGEITCLTNSVLLISKDGVERIIVDSGAPIRDKNSRIIGVVLVFRDYTEKRMMEEELLKAKKLESISLLAGGIAHDFNNLLTAILGNISLAKMMHTNPGDRIFERLIEAEKASLRAQNLTQQLLTFSRGGAPVLKKSPVQELLKESAMFALTGSDVRCEFYISDDIWQAEIDEGQISQVIHNMIINADQAMPDGGLIKVRAENAILEPGNPLPLKPGEYIKISIEDQGIGIPTEHLQKIFDPYFTTKHKGNGLGLATSYSIIKNHKGLISVKSRLGIGTTFSIYLPASTNRPEKNSQRSEGKPIAGKGNILVMDDEMMIRELALEMLRVIGYGTAVAEDGAEAVRLFKEARETGSSFDAVIMDLTVPGGMGGKEAVQKLIEIDSKAKVIASSGYSNDPVMSEYKKYGFVDVIAKPYRIKELSEVLHRCL